MNFSPNITRFTHLSLIIFTMFLALRKKLKKNKLKTNKLKNIFKLLKVKYCFIKNNFVPTAYVLLNSDLGTDVSIITEIKQILTE